MAEKPEVYEDETKDGQKVIITQTKTTRSVKYLPFKTPRLTQDAR